MNNHTISVQEYLHAKGVPIIKQDGKELIIHCLFNSCDKDSRKNEGHLYISKDDGLYDCKKCGEKGNLVTLKKHFGDYTTPTHSLWKQRRNFSQKLVDECAASIPERIRTYLNSRGVSNEVITNRKIGFGTFYRSQYITIPITLDEDAEPSFFYLRKDPANTNDKDPKNLSFPKGKGTVTLYGEYPNEGEDVVICEGVMDCLSLLSLGVKAVTSTGGCMTFKDEWVTEELLRAKRIFVAYDHDEAGERGAEKVLKLLKERKYKNLYRVTLPDVVGNKGDVNDYLARHKLPLADLFGKYAEPYPRQIDTTQFSEITIADVERVLSDTIKNDREVKLLVFIACLSAFTEDNQVNLILNAPSSSGKTYTVLQVTSLFPKDSLIEIGGASPTAFIHDANNKYDKETNSICVDLERKVIVLLDSSNPYLMEKLRPVLSHDKKEITYKTTDKSDRGGHRTKNTIIRGYASLINCSASHRFDTQEKTRSLMLSPEITPEKIQAGVERVVERERGGGEYDARIAGNKERQQLILRIEAIRNAEILDITISESNSIYLKEQFWTFAGNKQARHQRDIRYVISIAKTIALLNLWFRNHTHRTISVTRSDIDSALELYGSVAETQNIGIAPYLLRLYREVVVPCYAEHYEASDFKEHFEGVKYQDILNYHYKVWKQKLGFNELRQQYIPEYEACGLIEKSIVGGKAYFTPTSTSQLENASGTGEQGSGVLPTIEY